MWNVSMSSDGLCVNGSNAQPNCYIYLYAEQNGTD